MDQSRPAARQLAQLLALGLLIAVACLALGRWQWYRYQAKATAKDQVLSRYDAPATELSLLLTEPDRAAIHWRPARAVGRYDPGSTTLIRNRPRDLGGKNPTFGFDVVVPLRLLTGGTLLVNQGWVPNAQSAAKAGRVPESIPQPPTGQVEVTVTLRPSEPPRPQDLPPGQAASIDVQALGSDLPGTDVYGDLRSQTPAAIAAPLVPPRPVLDGGEGINASYAVQWILLAALAVYFPFWYTRRSIPVGLNSRPRRTRIWDEEDG